ncbi:MAG TPA: LuxR C-terminal-related transcriptional regulator [Gaiellaceae bacterium]|nr:LuxR C-terminal-related transcriptional regulator [Gaiellaceae bacterium]
MLEPAGIPVSGATAPEPGPASAYPRPRRGVVARTALVDRLCAAADTPVVTIVAPAGYGKTTLLHQWAERDGRPSIWLAPGEIDGAAFPRRRPALVIVDGAESLAADAAATLADGLPAGSTLALSARSEPPLPLARLRVEGRLLELGPDDLALTRREAQSLLRHAGVLLPGPEAAELERRTEGWAAGLQLAALSLRSGGDPWTFAGDDRYVADYLRAELLDRLTPSARAFVTRISVLERMTPAGCDAVLERRDSARRLEALERASLFVVPIDRSRRAYRYRRVVREFLRAELERREPELVATLNRRAAAWYEASGAPEAAADHAAAAGDLETVARLVSRPALPAYQEGRVVAVERWLRLLGGLATLDRHPDLCVAGAWIHALRGRPADAHRWADAAERGTVADDPRRRLLRALRCRDGTEQMLADAIAACDGLEPGSPWQPTALLALGAAHRLAGEDARADAALARAAEAAAAVGAADTEVAALSARSLVAAAHGAHADADALVREADAVAGAGRLGASAIRAVALAASARAALHRGDRERARADVAHAGKLRPLLTHAVPWLSVQAGVELGRAQLALADAAAARSLLLEVEAILRLRPALGTLVDETALLRAQVCALEEPDGRWASSLTAAELRLLPLLATHLSFREIGERLFVSRNTVKTQAISVYRKFGVSNRSDAIARAVELGLVDAAIGENPLNAA